MKTHHYLKTLCFLLLGQTAWSQVEIKVFKNYRSCLYGLVDTLSGDTLFEPQFTECERGVDYLTVRKNEYAGLIKLGTGVQVLPCRYQEIRALSKGETTATAVKQYEPWFMFKQNNRWGMLHLKKGVIQQPMALWMSKKPGSAEIAGLRHDSIVFWGDTTGYIQFFKGCKGIDHTRLEHFIMLRGDSLWSLANKQGLVLFPFEHRRFTSLENGHVHFKKAHTEGFIDQNGTVFFETERLKGPEKFGSTHYQGTSRCEVPGKGWGCLSFGAQLKWLLEPAYEYVVENEQTVYGYRDGFYDYVNRSTGNLIFKGISKMSHKRVYPKKAASFNITYLLFHGRLYQVNERTYKVKFLTEAEDFQLFNSRKLYAQIQGAWQVYENEVFKPIVGSTDLYYIGHNSLAVALNRGFRMVDSSGEKLSEHSYVQLYEEDWGAYLMTYDGNLHFYESSGKMQACEEKGRFITLRNATFKHSGYQVYDQQERNFISTAVYDSVNVLSENFVVAYQGLLTGIFEVGSYSFLADFGQYPITTVNYALRQLRFGDDSSSCIYSFNGNQITNWEQVELVKAFKDIGYFIVKDTFSIGLRSISDPEKWLIPPKYCAIADYDPQTKRASVRDGPIERFKKTPYWEEATVPTEGRWGVLNGQGKWLIEPIADVPIDLYKDSFLLQSDNASSMYLATGEQVWPSWYTQVSKFDSAGNAYWVNGIGGRGLIEKGGAYLVPTIYDFLVPAAEGIYAVTYPDSLPNAKVVLYNEQWEPKTVLSIKRLEVIVSALATISRSSTTEPCYIEEPTLQKAYQQWFCEKWIALNGPNVNEEKYAYELNSSSNKDHGFCHPHYRLPYSLLTSQSYTHEYAYTKLHDYRHDFGVSLVLEGCSGYSGHGSSRLYLDYNFVNLGWVDGRLMELSLWDFLDTSCKNKLNAALLDRLEHTGLDTYCAAGGMMVDAMADGFLIQDEHLVFFVSPADNFGQYTLEEGYTRISFRLEDWPLTTTFEAQRY